MQVLCAVAGSRAPRRSRTRRRAGRARHVAVLVLVVLMAGCTSDDAGPQTPEPAVPEPSASPASPMGASVAVVLPSDAEMDVRARAAVEEQVARLGAGDEGIREVRVLPADGPDFVADLAELMAERGSDLVCVVGADADTVVTQLARRYADVRFCALEAGFGGEAADPDDIDVDDESEPVDEDDPVARVVLRAEELGHLIGVTARIAADGEPVGVVLGGDALPAARFRAGLLAGLTPGGFVEAGGVGSLEEQAAEVVEMGAGVVVVDGGAGARDAIEAIVDEVPVIAPTSVLDADLAAQALVSWEVRWDLVLRGPLLDLVGDGADAAEIGLADDVFVVEYDGLPDDIAQVAERVTDELIAGERAPVTAAPAEVGSGGVDAGQGDS